MKLLKTVQKLMEEAEKDYYSACERCADERTIKRLEKNYLDTLRIFEQVNKIDSNKTKNKTR